MSLYQKINKNVRTHILPRIPFVGKHLKDVHLHSATFEAGHYYSPIVSREEIKKQSTLFNYNQNFLHGIDLNEEAQLQLLNELKEFYPPPFSIEPQPGNRYYYKNDFFSWSDAIFLYLMLRQYKPKRVIEVGSGHSSALMLDVNEKYFNGDILFSFIEPFPKRLFRLLSETDKTTHRVFEKKVQDIDMAIYDELEANDILFIDSSHVSKTGSDVNHILFEVLPRLKKGVLIHFHDICYPFEYPRYWIMEIFKGFGWNEAYMLRTFLMHNNAYSIVCYNSYLQKFHENWFKQHMPLCLNSIGGSIWLQKN
ncbi:MAG: class I SAM-dependent methyltransferase [Bacteroidota bacterium]